MIQRTAGETLAISDRVAMMPTVHPAAAGTHEYLECRRVTVRLTVIGRDNMRSTGEMVGVLPDWTGVLLARALSRFIWGGTGFTERQLQCLQPVAHRPGVRSQ